MTKLIIGLGNPTEFLDGLKHRPETTPSDSKYQNTRHNVGFMFLDYLVKKVGANNFTEDKKSNALVSKSKIEKTSVILAKPQTYVNKSGESVAKLKNFFKVRPENIIIIHDDLDIEFGNFKLSFGKNSGGHKGVESVMKALKTKNFWRLRFGMAVRALAKARRQSDKKRDKFVMKFVLSKFGKKEEKEIKNLFVAAYNKILSIS